MIVPLYNYVCAKGHTMELRGGYGDSAIRCPSCGKTAKREPYSGVPYSKTETGGDFLPGKPMREK